MLTTLRRDIVTVYFIGSRLSCILLGAFPSSDETRGGRKFGQRRSVSGSAAARQRTAASPVNTIEFTGVIALGSFLAGFLGALTGLGGGVVIVPLLALALGVDIRYAIGASLVAVIATSSGAAAAYVKEGFSNIRIGIFLEIATSMGALCGAFLATKLPVAAIGVIFGVVLLYSAYHSLNPPLELAAEDQPDRLAQYLKMGGTYPNRIWTGQLSGPRHTARFRTHGGSWYALRSARHRIGSCEGDSDGSGYAYPLQGFDNHKQFHDWCHGGS
jgi:hypothetical protein